MTPDGTVPGRDAIDRVATALYDAMFKREEADVARLHDVVELLTKEDCQPTRSSGCLFTRRCLS